MLGIVVKEVVTEMNYIEEFCRLKSDLLNWCPDSMANAQDLAGKLIELEKADADTCWNILWNKPLYAFQRVDVAERIVEALKEISSRDGEAGMGGAWKVWGEDATVLKIEKVGKGIAPNSFELTGALAEKFDNHPSPRISRHRLFYIQQAARVLRQRKRISDYPFANLNDCVHKNIEKTVTDLKKEFEVGWGHVTVLHALTDMGLAVKPDRHLVRTMQHLELFRLSKPQQFNVNQPCNINLKVGCLQKKLEKESFGADWWGEPYGKNNECESSEMASRRRLRWLDKILMEISRCGLLSEKGSGAVEKV